MKNDLIDRGALVRHLVNWQMESFSEVGHEKEYNLLDMIIRGIENEPTAYNVEKVIKELEEMKKRNDEFSKESTFIPYKRKLEYASEVCAKSINIVRNGGKE